MPAIGYIDVHVFTSKAQIPIMDAAVTITDDSADAIAFRLTNRNGKLNKEIEIEVPELAESQTPNPGTTPFTTVNIQARKENFEEVSVEKVQVFANTVTLQNIELIPLSEYPENWNKSERFTTPSQNL